MTKYFKPTKKTVRNMLAGTEEKLKPISISEGASEKKESILRVNPYTFTNMFGHDRPDGEKEIAVLLRLHDEVESWAKENKKWPQQVGIASITEYRPKAEEVKEFNIVDFYSEFRVNWIVR